MAHPARLTGALLVRKGHAFPAGGFAAANLNLAQPPAAEHGARPEPAGHHPAALAAVTGGHRPTLAPQAKVKLTVRLDPHQHSRLRIFAARRRCTSQEVIVRALEAYIQACGVDCACLRREPADCGRD